MSASSACTQARGQLALFVGGDLPEPAADGVREHLMSCRSCRGEASSLQQATAALRAIEARPDTVDDDMFAAMHRDIVAAVVEADVAREAAREHGRRVGRHWLLAAAATLLAAFGFWLGRGTDTPSVLWRAPSTAVGLQDDVIVVPYAGEPLEIRPLSDEWWTDFVEDAPDQVESAAGLSGMGGRLRLRTLVDERMLPQGPPR